MLRGLKRLNRSIFPRLWSASHRWHASASVLPPHALTPRVPLKNQIRYSSILRATSQTPDGLQPGELYEEVEIELPAHCPGCGVRLQQDHEEKPG